MGTVHFTTPDGRRLTVAIKPGNSVMEAAVASDVPGIEAQCYGAGICGTCHVYAQGAWGESLPPVSDWERDMIGNLALANAQSRLACQIRFETFLDGIEFAIPERQQAAS